MSKKLLSFCLVGLLCFVAGCHENHRNNGRDNGRPGPEQEGCGDVSYKGACSKDKKSVSYCDGNTLKTNTCKDNQICQLTKDDDNNDIYDCVEGGNVGPGEHGGGDCGAVTFKGVCGEGGKSVSYCDNNVLKTNTCLDNQSCQLTKGSDGSEYYDCVETKPAPQTGCGSYTNQGKCADDKKSVTYCSNDGKELKTDKCGDNEVCQELEYNGYKYNGCSISSAGVVLDDPTEFGDLKKECGSLGEGGVCSSDNKAYQYCNSKTNTIWAVKCDEHKSCQWVDQDNYHYLDCLDEKTEPQPSDTCDSNFKEVCSNNVITYCNDSNKVVTKKCDDGKVCKLNEESKKYDCVAGGSDVPPGGGSEGKPGRRPEDQKPNRP